MTWLSVACEGTTTLIAFISGIVAWTLNITGATSGSSGIATGTLSGTVPCLCLGLGTISQINSHSPTIAPKITTMG